MLPSRRWPIAIHAAEHVRDTGGQPDPGSRTRTDHDDWRSARNTLHRLASSTAPRRRNCAPAISSSMTPVRACLAGAGVGAMVVSGEFASEPTIAGLDGSLGYRCRAKDA